MIRLDYGSYPGVCRIIARGNPGGKQMVERAATALPVVGRVPGALSLPRPQK
jgi:hypothetical protein